MKSICLFVFSILAWAAIAQTPAEVYENQLQAQKASLSKGVFLYDMVSVEGGCFKMGQETKSTADLRQVCVSDFMIGAYEVTQAQWEAVMETNPTENKEIPCPNCPVVNIAWDKCQSFIKALQKKTGLHYRLPTEAEWEYAARGGRKSMGYPYAGSYEIDSVAWHNKNTPLEKPSPVGLKKPNELGLYDMSGNVSEWCADVASNLALSPQHNPAVNGTATDERVLKGGSYIDDEKSNQIGAREYSVPKIGDDFYGLRLVLVP